ncbi:MAG: aldehyde dehydrogenase, partial [Acidobacteria bacterium]|nr:aldehyde dehydrogenase [Acidobacteriota bacterium]
REFLFPFASVVEVKAEEVPAIFGPSLVVTAITEDPKIIRRLTSSPHIGRLNLGAIATQKISWDQPHEGNLFDHLYARRAFQSELAAV